MRKIFCYLLLLGLLFACGTRKKSAEAAAAAAPSEESVAAASPSRPGRQPVPKQDYGGREGVAIDLLRGCAARTPGNIIVSPYSAGVALSMLKEGAGGDTWTALNKALRCERYADAPFFTDAYNIVESANSVWVRDGFPVHADYTALLAESFRAQVGLRDFAGSGLPAEINRWCSDHTHGRIPSIIGRVDPSMVMLLINALYFKAPWQYPFLKEDTRTETFHAEDGDRQAPLMHRSAKFGYAERGGCQVAVLPYRDWNYGMLVVLPPEGTSVDKLLEKLTYEDFRAVRSAISYREKVILTFPKFRLEQTHTLNPVLADMGAAEIFTSEADFSRISPARLAVSQVLQKCFIEVGEEGTEAAAVTAITVGTTAVAPIVSHPVVMRVDRPFLLALVDLSDFNILFAGKIVSVP